MIDTAKMLAVVKQRTAAAPTEEPPPPGNATSKPMQGGWGDPGKEQDKAHYFRILDRSPATTAADGDAGATPEPTVQVESLCEAFTGECNPDELSECDPLSLDHCTECRVELLKYRGLI